MKSVRLILNIKVNDKRLSLEENLLACGLVLLFSQDLYLNIFDDMEKSRDLRQNYDSSMTTKPIIYWQTKSS